MTLPRVFPVDDDETRERRKRMAAQQIEKRGIDDPRVLAAFEAVPRHWFVPPEALEFAYEDYPLSIGLGQTISQPYICGLMTHRLGLRGYERVLEVGTGSGYQAAILGRLAAEVHSVEILPALAEGARQVLARLGLENVHVHEGDGSLGWPQNAPYDAILAAAAAPRIPPALLEQLSPLGRLIIPVGGKPLQRLEFWRRSGDGFEHEIVLPVVFVPLKGHYLHGIYSARPTSAG